MKKQVYVAPTLELIELEVEQGFAASLDGGSIGDYGQGGEAEELD